VLSQLYIWNLVVKQLKSSIFLLEDDIAAKVELARQGQSVVVSFFEQNFKGIVGVDVSAVRDTIAEIIESPRAYRVESVVSHLDAQFYHLLQSPQRNLAVLVGCELLWKWEIDAELLVRKNGARVGNAFSIFASNFERVFTRIVLGEIEVDEVFISLLQIDGNYSWMTNGCFFFIDQFDLTSDIQF